MFCLLDYRNRLPFAIFFAGQTNSTFLAARKWHSFNKSHVARALSKRWELWICIHSGWWWYSFSISRASPLSRILWFQQDVAVPCLTSVLMDLNAMLYCIQSVLHKLKRFRNCLLAPILMAINTRCLVSVSQMIHRGGRCQTAQLSYDGDNSVFMPEQNLSYWSKFSCKMCFSIASHMSKWLLERELW